MGLKGEKIQNNMKYIQIMMECVVNLDLAWVEVSVPLSEVGNDAPGLGQLSSLLGILSS